MGRTWKRLAIPLLVFTLMVSGAAFASTETVTLWTIGDESGTYGKVLKQIVPKVEARFPGLKIEVVYNSTTDKFAVAAAAGAGPDIVVLATRGAGAFVKNGIVAPIDREVFGIEKDQDLHKIFYGGAIGSLYMDGDVYFIPTEVTTLGTFVNLDLVAQAGLAPVAPATWEELLASGKKAVRRDAEGKITTAGLILNCHYIWPMLYWTALVRQAGTDWLVDDVPQFSNPAVVNNIEFYQDLFVTEQIAAANMSNANFYSGQAAYYVGGQYELAHMFNPDRVKYTWTTGGFPYFADGKRVSTSYAWGFYVWSGSPRQRLAWQVIEALTDEENAPVWYKTSSLLIPRAGDWIVELLSDDPRRMPFIEELDNAQLEIWHPEAGRIVNAILAAEKRLVDEAQPARSVLEELDREISALINP